MSHLEFLQKNTEEKQNTDYTEHPVERCIVSILYKVDIVFSLFSVLLEFY